MRNLLLGSIPAKINQRQLASLMDMEFNLLQAMMDLSRYPGFVIPNPDHQEFNSSSSGFDIANVE